MQFSCACDDQRKSKGIYVHSAWFIGTTVSFYSLKCNRMSRIDDQGCERRIKRFLCWCRGVRETNWYCCWSFINIESIDKRGSFLLNNIDKLHQTLEHTVFQTHRNNSRYKLFGGCRAWNNTRQNMSIGTEFKVTLRIGREDNFHIGVGWISRILPRKRCYGYHGCLLCIVERFTPSGISVDKRSSHCHGSLIDGRHLFDSTAWGWVIENFEVISIFITADQRSLLWNDEAC